MDSLALEGELYMGVVLINLQLVRGYFLSTLYLYGHRKSC
jgi:hypothetical protein